MNVDFMLVAGGDITMPRVNHVVWAAFIETAKDEAAAVVVKLAKAGYYRFELYDCSRTPENGGADKLIASYRVEKPEPIVIKN